MNSMKTKGRLKKWENVCNGLSGGVNRSPMGASLKIFHSESADTEHHEGMARDYNKERTGSPKGYICIHSDYKSMFDRVVTIGPKYNRNGSLNQHQCIVYGNRNKDCKAFNAYFEWFEDIDPIEHCNLGVPRMARRNSGIEPPRQTGIAITRVSWDQLFEV